MKSVIKYLFTTEDCLKDKVFPADSEFVLKQKRMEVLEDAFIEKLDKETKREFEDIIALHYSIEDYYVAQAFEDGFNIAIKLMFQAIK